MYAVIRTTTTVEYVLVEAQDENDACHKAQRGGKVVKEKNVTSHSIRTSNARKVS